MSSPGQEQDQENRQENLPPVPTVEPQVPHPPPQPHPQAPQNNQNQRPRINRDTIEQGLISSFGELYFTPIDEIFELPFTPRESSLTFLKNKGHLFGYISSEYSLFTYLLFLIRIIGICGLIIASIALFDEDSTEKSWIPTALFSFLFVIEVIIFIELIVFLICGTRNISQKILNSSTRIAFWGLLNLGYFEENEYFLFTFLGSLVSIYLIYGCFLCIGLPSFETGLIFVSATLKSIATIVSETIYYGLLYLIVATIYGTISSWHTSLFPFSGFYVLCIAISMGQTCILFAKFDISEIFLTLIGWVFAISGLFTCVCAEIFNNGELGLRIPLLISTGIHSLCLVYFYSFGVFMGYKISKGTATHTRRNLFSANQRMFLGVGGSRLHRKVKKIEAKDKESRLKGLMRNNYRFVKDGTLLEAKMAEEEDLCIVCVTNKVKTCILPC